MRRLDVDREEKRVSHGANDTGDEITRSSLTPNTPIREGSLTRLERYINRSFCSA